MKRIKVSNNVIRRMPRYLRKLDDLNAAGIERISSGELGRQMGLTPSQIRQDFSCFGEFGQQGYGYNVVALRGEVAKILGMNRNYSAVLVGVGNIGRALVENFCFEQYGFTLKAAFDINPDLIGKEITLDNRRYVIESVGKISGDVSMRDITFQNEVGLPISFTAATRFLHTRSVRALSLIHLSAPTRPY